MKTKIIILGLVLLTLISRPSFAVKVFDLSSSESYSVRFIGFNDNITVDAAGTNVALCDSNGDGNKDLLINAAFSSMEGIGTTGALYFI